MDRQVIREAAGEAGGAAARHQHLRNLFRWIYPLRVLGMAFGLLPVLVVLHELQAAWPFWAWALGACLLWPHVAWWHARRSKDPYRAELRNLMLDSALAGSLVPMMWFNLLPSVALMTVAVADKINSGVRGLWLRSGVAMLGGLLVAGVLTGFRLRLETSMPVLLACLPLLILHTLGTSIGNHRLVRRVQQQNRQLEMLQRRDSLTGLESRSYWESMASTLRVRCAGRQEASLMLLDVDDFKSVNDQHGHTVGDDLLRAIAACVMNEMPAGAHAGRLGGDEFVVALPTGVDAAVRVAEAIHARVRRIELPQAPGLQASVSIGIAAAPRLEDSLRSWREAADRMLYRAKREGRDCTRSAAAALSI